MIFGAALVVSSWVALGLPAQDEAEAPAPAAESPSEASPEAPPPPDCTDVYDQTGECAGLQQVPLEDVGEPVTTAPAEDEGSLLDVFSAAWLPWGLLGAGTAAVAGAAGFHLASFLYAQDLQRRAEQGLIGTESLVVSSRIQLALSVGAGAMWICAALLGGSALALWTFDPETGALRLPFLGE